MSERIQAIVMPKLGLSMTEGMVTKWYVSKGSKVEAGDIIADIETSKITNELEALQSGVIEGNLTQEGLDVPVGTLLGLIIQEDVTQEEVDSFISSFDQTKIEDPGLAIQDPKSEGPKDDSDHSSTSGRQHKVSTEAIFIPEELIGVTDIDQINASHLAKKMAVKLKIDLSKIEGSGRRGRISKSDIKKAIANKTASPKIEKVAETSFKPIDSGDSRISATPLARKMALQHGIDLTQIIPTGRNNRISRTDVESYLNQLNQTPSTEDVGEIISSDYEEITISSMRKRIGQRMTESVQRAPHFRLSIDVNVDDLLKVRNELNERDSKTRISINDMLIKACASALTEVPEVNAQYDGATLRRFKNAHIAVAVALKNGLITPVVKATNKKSIAEISHVVSDLANRAKTGHLSPDEITGGTFTISNLGMLGITSFDAIINPPQVAILAVGKRQRVLIEGDPQPIFGSVVNLTLSCDHRVIDGAIGARFLASLKEKLENPYYMT